MPKVLKIAVIYFDDFFLFKKTHLSIERKTIVLSIIWASFEHQKNEIYLTKLLFSLLNIEIGNQVFEHQKSNEFNLYSLNQKTNSIWVSNDLMIGALIKLLLFTPNDEQCLVNKIPTLVWSKLFLNCSLRHTVWSTSYWNKKKTFKFYLFLSIRPKLLRWISKCQSASSILRSLIIFRLNLIGFFQRKDHFKKVSF